jgi:hypothetical protein
MDHDEEQYKAATVTKPIELKPKAGGSSGLRRSEIHEPKAYKTSGDGNLSSSPEQQRGLAAVSILPVSRRRKPSPRPEVVEQIGHRLASIYNEVLSQPIPDRFLDLLSELEAGESPAKKTGTSAKQERK